jgi:phosphoenolpyruvate phosphomutase
VSATTRSGSDAAGDATTVRGEAPAGAAAALTRSARLRRMLLSERLEFLMEAHNGLSARIVREAGFGGIWASGLSMAAQFGVRDNNEASWTQIVDLLEFMVDASDLPILLDGDTGYGNFNNMRRLVRKLEQRGVAGVCIEDKQFPKTNSFLNGERQPLADVAEFAGKIMAGKDTQRDGDFCIVARVEALIAGWGMPEALRRAEAYRLAGADAILIHSKLAKADEIVTFAREWAGRAPLVIVPTRYYSTPTEVFREAGISMVIWANHMLRAAIAAMQSVAREVQLSQTLVNVEDRIVSVQEVFRLQDAEEYSEAERLYLAQADAARAAVVLAAGRGRGLEAVTTDRPKLMLPIGGRPLLGWLIESFKKEGVNDITVVGGYRAAAIDPSGIKLTLNERYAETGELASLACALNDMQSDTVVCYGDLLFRSYVLRDLLECEADFAVVVDSSAPGAINSTVRDFAFCSRSDDRDFFGSGALLQRVASLGDDAAGTPARASGPPTPQGRWIGMLHVRRQALARLKSVMAVLRARPDFDSLDVPALLNALVADGATVQVVYVHGHWRSVNDLEELRHAVDFAHGQNLLGAATDEDGGSRQ